MSDIRSWVERKLQSNGFSTTRLGSAGLLVERPIFPSARVLCVGLDERETFGVDDLDAVSDVMPDADFVVVVPTRIDHAAYEAAEELPFCLAGFGELQDALRNDFDIAHHVDSQEKYERRRLEGNRSVTSVRRRGHHAYKIERKGQLPPLTIITTNQYEFTVDQLYTLMETYGGIDPNLIVVTNPNCHGFSTDALQASKQVGVPIVVFSSFLDELGTRWT